MSLLKAVADPGFPRGGGANSLGGANIRFAKFSEKLHEIERIWTPGGRVPHAPPSVRHWKVMVYQQKGTFKQVWVREPRLNQRFGTQKFTSHNPV